MKRIQALVRPVKLEALREALEEAHVASLTIVTVRCRGAEGRLVSAFRGFLIPHYTDKLEIDIVVPDHDVDRIVGLILKTARTADPDDGHISVSPIEHRYSIHTGHREVC